MPKTLQHRQTRSLSLSQFETRDNADGSLSFTGYASTFNQPYSMGWFTETVRSGAFTKTLSEQPDVRLLINHGGLPLARTKSGTLQLAQDDLGLHVQASLDPADPDVQSLVPKLKRGDVDQMSFGFRIIRQEWSPDYDSCDLTELALDDGDVSIVTYPANPSTSAAMRALRSRNVTFSPADIRQFYGELATVEQRSGAVFSASNRAILTALLNDLTDIGDAVNEIAADVSDAGDQLGDLLAATDNGDAAADASDAAPDEADDESRASTVPLSLALAQAQALRLRA